MAMMNDKAIKDISNKIRDMMNWVEIAKTSGDMSEDTAEKMIDDLQWIASKLGVETL